MRVWNWVERMHDCIEDARRVPFDYGTANCALFVAKHIDAIVDGSQRETEMRALFGDAASAHRYLVDVGGLDAGMTQRFGEPVSWPLIRRGDVALVPTQDGPALGVCMGAVIYVRGPEALATVPLDAALMGWRID